MAGGHGCCPIESLGGAHGQRPQAAGGDQPADRAAPLGSHLRQPGNRLDGDRLDRGTAPAWCPDPVLLRHRCPPQNGPARPLEGNIDFDDRVNVIADFHQDPMTSRQHLGLSEYR